MDKEKLDEFVTKLNMLCVEYNLGIYPIVLGQVKGKYDILGIKITEGTTLYEAKLIDSKFETGYELADLGENGE